MTKGNYKKYLGSLISEGILALVPLQKKIFAQGRVLALFSGNVTKVKISTF
jgi:hypothetical protein